MALEIVERQLGRKGHGDAARPVMAPGVPEYWLVDAPGDRLEFDIFRHAAASYVATRKHAGWLKSGVFGKSFRLSRHLDDLGDPEFSLAVQ